MPIQNKNLGKYKYPRYDPTWEEVQRGRIEEKTRRLRELRKRKLEEFKEKELIKQIDIQYRRKKLEAISKIWK